MIRLDIENYPEASGLLSYIWRIINRIKNIFDNLAEGQREIRTQTPINPQEGMIVFADGSGWDPGHGRGSYEYSNGEWEPLFTPVLGIKTSRTTVQNTTTSTELYSHTIPANALHTGMLVEFFVAGLYSNDSASDDWTLYFKINGVTAHTLTRTAGNVTDEAWSGLWAGTVRTNGASGTYVDRAVLQDDGTFYTSAHGPLAIDTTVAITASVELQWANAKAGNVFHCDQGYISFFH